MSNDPITPNNNCLFPIKVDSALLTSYLTDMVSVTNHHPPPLLLLLLLLLLLPETNDEVMMDAGPSGIRGD